jgi:hypothetical protein
MGRRHGMQRKYAVLIDAGFLKRKLGSQQYPMTSQAVCNFTDRLKTHPELAVDVIVMVTGDSDFIPAMKFARREGKQIYLFSLGHSLRSEVVAHTDIYIEDPVSNL